MNIVVEKQPKCTATLRVEIPADEVKGKRDAIVGKYARQARVPGFRPGKAPVSVVAKRFEKEISSELSEDIANQAFDEAMKQNDLKVLDFGAPADLSPAADGSVSFIAILTLAPDIILPDYKGIAVTVPPLEVPQDEIDAQLKALQERFAEFKDLEGRPLAMGDFAVIDYTSTVEGKPTEEFLGKPAGHLTGRDGYWVRLDEKAFLPGFAAALEGLSTGDAKDISVTIPDDFPLEDLRGKEITFAVTVKESKQAVLPELNNEFAAKLAPGKTMEELTEIIRGNMATERKRRIDDMKVNQIAAYLSGAVECDLPEELVNQEVQTQADQMAQRALQAGMSEEELEAQEQQIFASAGQQAVSNLRTNFILQEIARAENLTVSNNELVNHLAAMARQRKEAPKKFIKEIQRSGRLSSVSNSLVIGKAIDFLVGNASVTESAESTVEE
ncbi:MAG: trigger factor [Verrucomicrobiota bacterium]